MREVEQKALIPFGPAILVSLVMWGFIYWILKSFADLF